MKSIKHIRVRKILGRIVIDTTYYGYSWTIHKDFIPRVFKNGHTLFGLWVILLIFTSNKVESLVDLLEKD